MRYVVRLQFELNEGSIVFKRVKIFLQENVSIYFELEVMMDMLGGLAGIDLTPSAGNTADLPASGKRSAN